MSAGTHAFAWEDPTATLTAGQHRSGLEIWRGIAAGELPHPPIGALMDFTLPLVEEGRIVFASDAAPWMLNPIGSVHGGVYATLLDSATGCAVHSMLPAGVGYTSLDLTVKFLRPVTVDSGLLTCEGTVIQRGRRTALAQAQLSDEAGQLVAHATSSCMIFTS